mmetsp:Transcript_134189/g.428781  ORF Transcript_134189/g.428781 Transcript_134189/m.428781 type:complete len:285 (-) Transcript_134189:761-1615(-)
MLALVQMSALLTEQRLEGRAVLPELRLRRAAALEELRLPPGGARGHLPRLLERLRVHALVRLRLCRRAPQLPQLRLQPRAARAVVACAVLHDLLELPQGSPSSQQLRLALGDEIPPSAALLRVQGRRLELLRPLLNVQTKVCFVLAFQEARRAAPQVRILKTEIFDPGRGCAVRRLPSTDLICEPVVVRLPLLQLAALPAQALVLLEEHVVALGEGGEEALLVRGLGATVRRQEPRGQAAQCLGTICGDPGHRPPVSKLPVPTIRLILGLLATFNTHSRNEATE